MLGVEAAFLTLFALNVTFAANRRLGATVITASSLRFRRRLGRESFEAGLLLLRGKAAYGVDILAVHVPQLFTRPRLDDGAERPCRWSICEAS